MLDAFDDHGGELRDVLDVIPDEIPFEDADDLVVRLTAVDELEAADDAGPKQHFRTLDGPLADDADVERITVAAFAAGSQFRDPRSAIGLGDESVEGGRL